MILNASAGKQLPVYGAGLNVRDWIHVDDHAAGLITALETGKPGETYLFGGSAERTNIDVVSTICDLVDDRLGTGDTPRRELITHVEDRPGHDLRYAIDSSKAESELGWRPSLGFEEGLASTVDWYVANEAWWKPLIEEREANVRRGRAG